MSSARPRVCGPRTSNLVKRARGTGGTLRCAHLETAGHDLRQLSEIATYFARGKPPELLKRIIPIASARRCAAYGTLYSGRNFRCSRHCPCTQNAEIRVIQRTRPRMYQTDAIAETSASPSLALGSTVHGIDFRKPIGHHHPSRSVALTGLLVMVGMTLYESAKQYFLPNITIWQSHIITILVAAAASALSVYRLSQRNMRTAPDIEGTVENAFDAVITLDGHGRVTTWNLRAAVMFGWSREEALGKSFIDLVTPIPLKSSISGSSEAVSDHG